MDDNCNNCELKNRVTKLEESFNEIREEMRLNDQKVLLALDGLKGLPEALQGLKETTLQMNAELKSNTDKVAALSDRVEKIDEKSKFDIMGFLKSNWPWITVLLLVGTMWMQNNVPA